MWNQTKGYLWDHRPELGICRVRHVPAHLSSVNWPSLKSFISQIFQVLNPTACYSNLELLHPHLIQTLAPKLNTYYHYQTHQVCCPKNSGISEPSIMPSIWYMQPDILFLYSFILYIPLSAPFYHCSLLHKFSPSCFINPACQSPDSIEPWPAINPCTQ